MARIFYPTSEPLHFLLDSIHNREVGLPDFQRDFVWDPRATDELLESLCQNFPAGSLLRIKNSGCFYFAPREFAGAPPLDGHEPAWLILDGQQRLTSLYEALYGAGEHRFYMDLTGLMEGRDLEDCVFYLRRVEGDRRFGTIEQQAQRLVFPLDRLFRHRGGFEGWLDRVIELHPQSGDKRQVLKDHLRDLRDKWLVPVEDYEFPMVTLADDTCAAAVCTIFETLNRTGVKLSVFDLLAARFWPENVRLRELWDQARRRHPIVTEFEVDPYYLLQSVALLTAPAAPSCKRTDVLMMSVEQVRSGWDPVVEGLAEMLHILRDDCGVILPQWLPYKTIVIPGAGALATAVHATGPEIGAVRNKLKRWFWCSVFGQAYEMAPNSQAAKDYAELRDWFRGGAPPETVADFAFDPASLRDTTARQRAVYRGVIALTLGNGARDFYRGDRINAGAVMEKKIDDHHVFPHAFLAEKHPEVSNTLRDCILNRTLVDRDTDVRIGRRAPSDYLAEIARTVKPEQLDAVLASHLLPAGPGSPLCRDDFPAFLEERQSLIWHQIHQVTG